jgi:hypothetical protein
MGITLEIFLFVSVGKLVGDITTYITDVVFLSTAMYLL